jgi:hypothetical protein
VTHRRGASKLGCLFGLLILATAAYFGANIGQVYWRFYQYQDDMQQQVRFARSRTDEQIATHLRAKADSLGLPEAAKVIEFRRDPHKIWVATAYSEHIELPMFVREFHFRPHAEGPL